MVSTQNTDQSYNGWANYETWLANLWLTNTQADYFTIKELIKEAADVYSASQAIKSYVEELNPLVGTATMYADLLSASLRAIDWMQIAESFMEE